MRRRRRWVGALLTASALCVLAGLLLPGDAGATRGGLVQVAVNGEDFTARPGGPLLDVNGLAPGSSTTAEFGVRSGLATASALMLRLIDVHDDDNGCTPPEALVDHSCGQGGGELGADLVVTLDVATTRTGSYAPAWSGSAARLARGIDTGITLPVGAQRWIRLTAALPAAVGNAVQSDTFDFLTRIELSTTSGVAGVTVSRHPSPSAGVGPLAITGTSLILLVVGGLLLVVAGAATLVSGARRRAAER